MPGTAAMHFNDVDSASNTHLGLFNFAWAGLRIADLRNPSKPVEVGYFKPGDFCTGHVRYFPETGVLWAVCGQSGFYVLQLSPELRDKTLKGESPRGGSSPRTARPSGQRPQPLRSE